MLIADMVNQQQHRRGHGVIECVFLTSFRSESSSVATVFQYSGVRLHRADSLEEAGFLLTVTGATVFLADVTFLDGNWCDALAMAAQLHPGVTTLIVADPVDSSFLRDACDRGALGVLWRPFDFTRAFEMIRTARQAAEDRAIWLAEISPDTAGPVHSISKATY
jgi:DNA-binding NtrC family response regulator